MSRDVLVLWKWTQGSGDRSLEARIGLGNFRMGIDIVKQGVAQRQMSGIHLIVARGQKPGFIETRPLVADIVGFQDTLPRSSYWMPRFQFCT